MRARLFRAPRPLAAGWIERGAAIEAQLLATELVEGARPLDEALREVPPAGRAALLDELADETARLHALHFVHRNLFPRNLLVAPPSGKNGDPRRLWWIDAWRGGAALPGRGPAYDLGCFMLAGAGLLAADEQRRLVARYLAERAAQGRPADARRLLAAAARTRERLLRQIEREPGRWRERAPPEPEWPWERLLTS